MASLQMMNSGFCAFPRSKLRESRGFLLSPSYLYLKAMTGSSLGSKSHVKERRRNGVSKSHRVSCELQNGSSQNKGEEPPESLFMKELRRRGITPTSLLEETNRSAIDEEMKEQGSDRSTKRNTVATGIDRSLTNQREQSMALNSEGLEGLIPRAKLLLTLGGTFFMAFWPLIFITVSAFAALYLCFGPSFIHDASGIPVAPPQYIDPYVLLQDERMGQ